MGRRFLLGVAIGAGLVLPAPAPAEAESLPMAIATVQAETPISAGGGWLVWSVPVTGGWGLEAYHGGAVQSVPVRPRPQPFDVSVGTNSRGMAVAAFSRCTTTPRMLGTGEGGETGGMLLTPRSGAGCRIHVLELATGRESAVPIPHPSGASDTTPSMWHGSVAFARKAPGHREVWQVMLYSPHHPGRLSTLRHGAVPTHCPSGCAGQTIRGEVQALDFDGQVVAFVWSLEAPGVIGEMTWEQRVDELSSGHSGLAGTPILTESCTGSSGVEEEWPGPPFLTGGAAFFSTLERGDCYKKYGTAVVRLSGSVLTVGEIREPVISMARDGAAAYALVAPVPTQEQEPTCPCTLERISLPALAPARYKPTPPFASA